MIESDGNSRFCFLLESQVSSYCIVWVKDGRRCKISQRTERK